MRVPPRTHPHGDGAGLPTCHTGVTKEQWADRKPQVKYAQLPVLHVDGKELCQSDAALRFLGATLKGGELYPPSDPLKQYMCDEVLSLLDDFRRAMFAALSVKGRPKMFGHEGMVGGYVLCACAWMGPRCVPCRTFCEMAR